jgi:hypothetical protein
MLEGNTCAEQSFSDDSPMYTVLYVVRASYSSSSLWSFKSEGHCRFSLRLTFNRLLNSVTYCFRVLLVGYSIRLSISLFLL